MRTVLALLLLSLVGYLTAQTGPAAVSIGTAVITWGDCKLCEIDCQYNNILKCPSDKRYYRYGCHIKSYCFDLASFHPRDFDAAMAFCMAKNGCVQNRDGIYDNRQNTYADNNPAVQRRLQAEADVLKENAFLRAAIGEPYQRMNVENRKKSCEYSYYYKAPQFYEELKQQFSRGQVSATDVYLKVQQECDFAHLTMQDFEAAVVAKTQTAYNNGYSKVTLTSGYTLIKSKLFSIAHVPQVFNYYFKVIADAYDLWSLISKDTKAMDDFVKQTNAEIAKIPNFLGEKLAGSQEQAQYSLATEPIYEIYRYLPLTAQHIYSLGKQITSEGGLRAVTLLNLVNSYADEGLVNLKKMQEYYGMQAQSVDDYLHPGKQRDFVLAYIALLRKFDPDFVNDNNIYQLVDGSVSTKFAPTYMVLRLLFGGGARDKAITIFQAKTGDVTFDYNALEEGKIKDTLFSTWYYLPDSVKPTAVDQYRLRWSFPKTSISNWNGTPQTIADKLRAVGYVVSVTIEPATVIPTTPVTLTPVTQTPVTTSTPTVRGGFK